MKWSISLLSSAALLAALTLAGCGSTPADTAGPEDTAKQVLTNVYSCDTGDSDVFEQALAQSATSETALADYVRQRAGDFVTDEGCDTLLGNRVVSRVLTAWPGTAVQAEDVSLTETYTQTETEAFYSYELTAVPTTGEGQTFSGEISLVCQDGVWYVNSVQ